MDIDDKKIIKTLLLCLPFIAAFACGAAYMEMYHPEIMKKISIAAVIAYAVIIALIIINTYGIKAFLGIEDPVISSKSSRTVNRTLTEKNHKRLTADYVPGYDRVDDTDDDVSVGNDNNSNEFRRPIGVIPTPEFGSRAFTDYEGHQYYSIGGRWYDDIFNSCPDYMGGYYGIPNYEESQNDDW